MLGRYELVESHVFEDTTQGYSYRFSDGSRDRVTVFVYSGRPDAKRSGSPQDWVAAEGASFSQTFPIGVQRGWYDNFTVAFANPEPLFVADSEIPGYATGVATIRGGETGVEVQYVYFICDRFIKVRGTLSGRTWQNSDVPTFAKNLARHLAGIPDVKPRTCPPPPGRVLQVTDSMIGYLRMIAPVNRHRSFCEAHRVSELFGWPDGDRRTTIILPFEDAFVYAAQDAADSLGDLPATSWMVISRIVPAPDAPSPRVRFPDNVSLDAAFGQLVAAYGEPHWSSEFGPLMVSFCRHPWLTFVLDARRDVIDQVDEAGDLSKVPEDVGIRSVLVHGQPRVGPGTCESREQARGVDMSSFTKTRAWLAGSLAGHLLTTLAVSRGPFFEL